jgi:hypothetical protein
LKTEQRNTDAKGIHRINKEHKKPLKPVMPTTQKPAEPPVAQSMPGTREEKDVGVLDVE